MNKLIIFDIDDTLSDNSWWRLNLAAGVTPEEDYALYLGFANGEFNYHTWTTRLAEIYRRENQLTEALAREVLTAYTLKDDTTTVVSELKHRGYEIILITGGFDTTAAALGQELRLENYFATSRLEFDSEGKFLNLIVVTDDGEAKVEILKKYLLETGKSVADCIAIGDSSNDIPLFNFTKNGIAFTWSKDPVKAAATQTITTLTDLLTILK